MKASELRAKLEAVGIYSEPTVALEIAEQVVIALKDNLKQSEPGAWRSITALEGARDELSSTELEEG